MSKLKGFIRKYSLFAFVLIFVLIRLINLPNLIEFGSDQGRDFLAAWNMYTDKTLTLIGPPSEFTFNGRQFFFGPAPYYVILPALIIGNWSPQFVSYFIITLNAAVFLISLIIIKKTINDKSIFYFFALLYIFSPILIKYSQSYWNPYFMLPVGMLLADLLLIYKIKHSMLINIAIGFLFGLGMQFHYSFVFAIIAGAVWILISGKLYIKSVLIIILGFIIGFSPIILFELRNNFYNIRTLLLILSNFGNLQTEIQFQNFYLISLLPFVLLFFSFCLAKLHKFKNICIYSLLGFIIIYSLLNVTSKPSYVLGYPTLIEISEVIRNDSPKDFNIVDQLTRDNQASALRYLLTIKGKAPLGISDYPKSKILYIYSKEDIGNLMVNPVWEISSIGDAQLMKSWEIGSNVKIFKSGKIN